MMIPAIMKFDARIILKPRIPRMNLSVPLSCSVINLNHYKILGNYFILKFKFVRKNLT